jgi:DNA-binding phage protein
MLRRDINLDLKLGDVAKEAQLGPTTVSRFFHRGKGGGKTGYSLFHGPNFTTVVGIARALGMELRVTPAQTATPTSTRRRKARVQFL